MGIQESWEKEGGGIGCKVGQVALMEKNRTGQGNKNRGAGGVGFLVKLFLCGIIEVIEDTKCDERGTRGEGSEIFFHRKLLHAPRI